MPLDCMLCSGLSSNPFFDAFFLANSVTRIKSSVFAIHVLLSNQTDTLLEKQCVCFLQTVISQGDRSDYDHC